MLVIKSLLLALCGAAFAAPTVSERSAESSPNAARALAVRDWKPAAGSPELIPFPVEERSLAIRSPSELQARDYTSGDFNVKWTCHLDGAKDFILSALLTYAQGAVYAASGSGVYVSPLASLGKGQLQFRVSYLSANAVYTAVARVIFDVVGGQVLGAFDEGVEKNGADIRSALDVSFKGT